MKFVIDYLVEDNKGSTTCLQLERLLVVPNLQFLDQTRIATQFAAEVGRDKHT